MYDESGLPRAHDTVHVRDVHNVPTMRVAIQAVFFLYASRRTMGIVMDSSEGTEFAF